MKSFSYLLVTFGLLACSTKIETAATTLTDYSEQDSISVQPADTTRTDTANIVKLSFSDKAALTLYNEYVSGFNAENKSTVISPLSIRVALTMLANGTDGDQRQGLLRVAGWDENDMEKVNATALQNIKMLMKCDASAKVAIANNIWYNPTFTMNIGFTSTLDKYYDVQPVAVEQSKVVEAVNSWCSEKTNGLIKEIIKQVDKDYKMLLANALYFQCPWWHVFDENNTTDMPFTTAEGMEVVKPFMKSVYHTLYAKNADYAMVELELGKRGRFLMDVILPNNGKSIAGCLESIKKDGILETTTKRVDLAIPKFNIESEEGISSILAQLTKMGIEEIDFSLISEGELKLSEIKHAARLTADETGVEGAAVTAGAMVGGSPGVKLDNANFCADHPFCVLIKERTTGEILFIGQVCE